MKKFIRLLSDIHLEGFSGHTADKLAECFVPVHDLDSESVLVLAGDISSKEDQLLEFILALESRFDSIVYTIGNHELYKKDYSTWCSYMEEKCKVSLKNTTCSFDSPVVSEISGIRFIVAPLWGDGGISILDQIAVGQGLNDFLLIKNGDQFFTVKDMINVHKRHKDFIRETLSVPFSGKTVVVTHHLPSRKIVSERFLSIDGSDGINGGFVGACDDLIEEFKPDFWVHGHTHDSIDMKIGSTRIIANPRGYRGEWGTKFNRYSNFFVKL